MGGVMSFFKRRSNTTGDTSGSSNSGSVNRRTASYGSKKSSTSGDKAAHTVTQKKHKYSYIPDNFTSIEQVLLLSVSDPAFLILVHFLVDQILFAILTGIR